MPATGPIPGLVERHEPLAPGEAHVDPAAPHGRPRRTGPGHDPWFAWRVPLLVWLMPVMSLLAVWVAVGRGTPRPLLAAVPWTATSVVARRALTRLRRSAGSRRDDLRFGGQMLVCLLLLWAGVLALAL